MSLRGAGSAKGPAPVAVVPNSAKSGDEAVRSPAGAAVSAGGGKMP